jgi:hypothetical protein
MSVIGSVARGPLTLKYLWEALALPEDNNSGWELSKEAIKRGGFEIEAEHTWKVHLLHLATKTFLGSKDRSGQLHINSKPTSTCVINWCYQYLGLKPPHPDRLVSKDGLTQEKLFTSSTWLQVQSGVTVMKDYACDRPLYDYAVPVVENYIPFQRCSIMKSMEGGDGSHASRNCFVAYWILHAFQTGRVSISEAYGIGSSFCQCCLRSSRGIWKPFPTWSRSTKIQSQDLTSQVCVRTRGFGVPWKRLASLKPLRSQRLKVSGTQLCRNSKSATRGALWRLTPQEHKLSMMSAVGGLSTWVSTIWKTSKDDAGSFLHILFINTTASQIMLCKFMVSL